MKWVETKTGRTVKLREQPFMKALLERLQLIPDSHWERQNAGVTVVGTGPSRRVFRGAPAGAGDIVGIVGPIGLHVEVEVKVGARQTAAQREREAKLTALGALYVLVRYDATLLPTAALEQAGGEVVTAINLTVSKVLAAGISQGRKRR